MRISLRVSGNVFEQQKHLRFIVGDDNEIDFYLGIFILENIAKQTERKFMLAKSGSSRDEKPREKLFGPSVFTYFLHTKSTRKSWLIHLITRVVVSAWGLRKPQLSFTVDGKFLVLCKCLGLDRVVWSPKAKPTYWFVIMQMYSTGNWDPNSMVWSGMPQNFCVLILLRERPHNT